MKRLFICVLLLVGWTGSVSSQVTADFGGRTGGTVIPAGWQGVNDMHHLDSTSTVTMTNAAVKVSRVSLSLAQVWANCPSPCTASYTAIDGQTDLAASGGYKLEIYIQLTPPDLGATTCTPPSNNTTWATRAAAAIAHVDARHSGVALYWGVWNEPDLTGNLCPGSGTNLQAYLPIYAAAAPAMITQVSTDGQTALVGGPTLGSPAANAATWLANTSTGLLGNTGTAPSVQFVDYHSYLGGCTVSWSACFTALQNASTGQNALYASINTLVRAGTQPNASTTPILVTEYNDSSAFSADPVRNDPFFGPLWNAVSLIDWLNTSPIPQGLWYYNSASSGSATFFCLFGNWAAGDCSQPPLNPYPQFYLYELINSLVYMNLGASGHLAASVSPGSSTSGLQAAAWYTSTNDCILMANPTSSPVSTGTITLNNAGYSGLQSAYTYLLNGNNASLTTAIVGLTPIVNGYTIAAVSIPANSVLAVSLPGAAIVPTSL